MTATMEEKPCPWYKIIAETDFQTWLTKNQFAVPETNNCTKTLALDLDNTLTFEAYYGADDSFALRGTYGDIFYRKLRTGVISFLNEVRPWFKSVVIFTSSSLEYAELAAAKISTGLNNNPFDAILSRSDVSTVPGQGTVFKDMFKIPGVTDLKDVFLLDDDPLYALPTQTNNVLHIPGVGYKFGFKQEDCLKHATSLVIHLSQVEDVRQEIKRFRKIWKDEGLLEDFSDASC